MFKPIARYLPILIRQDLIEHLDELGGSPEIADTYIEQDNAVCYLCGLEAWALYSSGASECYCELCAKTVPALAQWLKAEVCALHCEARVHHPDTTYWECATCGAYWDNPDSGHLVDPEGQHSEPVHYGAIRNGITYTLCGAAGNTTKRPGEINCPSCRGRRGTHLQQAAVLEADTDTRIPCAGCDELLTDELQGYYQGSPVCSNCRLDRTDNWPWVGQIQPQP